MRVPRGWAARGGEETIGPGRRRRRSPLSAASPCLDGPPPSISLPPTHQGVRYRMGMHLGGIERSPDPILVGARGGDHTPPIDRPRAAVPP